MNKIKNQNSTTWSWCRHSLRTDWWKIQIKEYVTEWQKYIPINAFFPYKIEKYFVPKILQCFFFVENEAYTIRVVLSWLFHFKFHNLHFHFPQIMNLKFLKLHPSGNSESESGIGIIFELKTNNIIPVFCFYF